MKATHQDILSNLALITDYNKTVQICPESANTKLISLGKLYDDDCIVLLTKRACTIYKNCLFKLIMKAKRYPTIGIHITRLTNPLLLNNSANQFIYLFNSNLQ